MSSILVVPCILLLRSRVRVSLSTEERPTQGEFSILGGENLPETNLEDGTLNGKSSIERTSHSSYYHLVDPAELQPIPLSRRNSAH